MAPSSLPPSTPDVLRRLRRNIQLCANEIKDDTIEERTSEKGRQFLIEEALFLVDTDVFTVDEDEDFDVREEFASDKNKIQGQLRQVLQYLTDDVKYLCTKGLISGAIVDDIKPFETSSGRFNAFAKFIGHQPGTETSEPFYSKLDVPVLYDGWHGKKDLNRLFRNPILLKIHACIIRGPNGADGLFDGKSKRPTAKTVERMYKICCTTPGAIANAACLAIWLHSADTQLVEVGDETATNYCERHTYYLQRILDGLANDKAWAVSLFTHWDHILFPDVDKPHESTRPATSPPPTPQDSTTQNSSPTAPANPRRSPSPTVPILTPSASHCRGDRGRASSESPAPTPSTSNNAPAPNDRPQLPVPSTSNPAPAPTIRPRPQRQGKAVYRQ
ncbi:hypothetical protein C8J57DRAFT_1376606 [Mycena rebaudengoi]|nr:hypothetical protein C8J57DRAFT_1376606 [Mycena rebaudengoi]